MKEEYARLSLKVGLFCGRGDAFLGRDHFGSRLREKAWELTPELFKQLQEEARSMGIPDEVVAETAEDQATESSMIRVGLEAQKLVDRRSVH